MATIYSQPAVSVSGTQRVHSLLAREIEIPDDSVGYVHFEVDPSNFTPDNSLSAVIETKIGDGEWKHKAGNGLPVAGREGGKHPEPLALEWGYNTKFPPLKGQKVLARVRFITTGDFITPITIERSP